MPICFKCNAYLGSVKSLHTHFKIAHLLHKEENEFRCIEGGDCFSSFSNWYKFKQHLLLKHSCPKIEKTVCDFQSSTTSKSYTEEKNKAHYVENKKSHLPYSEQENIKNSGDEPPTDIPNLLQDIAVQFAAKLFANHKMPRSHVLEIMNEISNTFTEMLHVVKPIIRKDCIENRGTEDFFFVDETLDFLVTPFSKLSSEYMYLKTLNENGHLIESVNYVLSPQNDDIWFKGQMTELLRNATAKFIPMRHVLKKIFSLPNVFSSVGKYMDELKKDNNNLENFVQGNLWRNKIQNHFKNKIVLPIFIFFDDFEVKNPLSSYAGIQKLGAVYYSIPCFPPQVQSLLENIFVAALFHSEDKLEFTNQNAFQKVIEEINFLQTEGIIIETESGPIHIYFALGLVLGDNLGMNQSLGFQEGFNAYYSCRFCKTSKLQMQWETLQSPVRTIEMYNKDATLASPKSTVIKQKSVWNNVEFFETAENFSVDFLHDGPEGTLKKFMGLIVHYFAFTLKSKETINFLVILNDRLKSFDCYHNSIKNRPPLISHEEAQEKSTKMSASEMQTFILIFSMLVGDLVPHDDEVWEFYLCIRRVMDIILAKKVPKSWGKVLKSYIEEMYKMYLKVFPAETVTIKLHNFLHYHTVLGQSGPLVNLSTYRFESKHKHKKTEANATSCRRNILETLCHKEILCLAYRFILGKGVAPNNAFGKREKIHDIRKITDGYTSCVSSLDSSLFEKCSYQFSWVEINGITYRKGSCLVIKLEGEDEVLPIFGIIDIIIQNDLGNIGFICKLLDTMWFNSDYYAYNVEETNDYNYVQLSTLMTPFPAITAHVSDKYFATLPYAL